MPMYEFYCGNCGKLHEEIVAHDVETVDCFCGGTAHKALSKANWSIKGTCSAPTAPSETEKSEPDERGFVDKTSGNGRTVLYDIFCPECDTVVNDVLVRTDEDPEDRCPECGAQMKKRCACGSFELLYDPKKHSSDWSGNTTRYWDDVNAARRRGEDVKPAGEE